MSQNHGPNRLHRDLAPLNFYKKLVISQAGLHHHVEHLARDYAHDHNIMELWARLRLSPQSRKVDVRSGKVA